MGAPKEHPQGFNRGQENYRNQTNQIDHIDQTNETGQTDHIVALNPLCFSSCFGTNVLFKGIDNDRGISDTNKKSS